MRRSKFSIGQIIHHRRFGYRGVIYDIDAEFGLTEEWYEQVAKSRPPKDQSWYRVLVDGGTHETYVAERHLEQAEDNSPIEHHLALELFDAYKDGHYIRDRALN